MKAKKLMGLIAFASAFVSLSAFANTTNGWFGVTVSDTVVTVNISTNGVGVAESNAIKLTEVAQETPLVFTPNADFEGTNRNDGIYVIGASVALTPCSTNDFNNVDVGSAKAGIVAGFDENNVTSYYGYASGATGTKWIKLENEPVVAPGQDTTFAIVLNYRDNKVNFMIRKIVEENPVDTWFGPYDMADGASALANIKAWGTGSISSVTGAFEVAVSQYGDKKYGSVAEAMDKAGDDRNNIEIVKEDGTVDASSKGVAENGLQMWQCAVLHIEPSAQVTLAKSTKQNGGQITLAVGVVPEDGVTVKYLVNGTGTEFDADNIQIPMTTGTYTITPVFK